MDLVPVFFIVWLASVVRVGGAVMRHETFGTEPILATLAIVLLPYLVRESLGSFWSRVKAL